MEKKPSIFKPNISNKINNNRKVYYSFIEESIPNLDERHKIDPVDKLKELMNKDGYIFNKKVIIKTDNNIYDTRIAGTINDKIITIDGNSIYIKDIREIIEK